MGFDRGSATGAGSGLGAIADLLSFLVSKGSYAVIVVQIGGRPCGLACIHWCYFFKTRVLLLRYVCRVIFVFVFGSLCHSLLFSLLFVFAVDVAKQQDVRIVQQARTAVPALLSQAREHLMVVLSRVDNAGTDKTARNIAVAQVKPAVRHLEPLFSLIKELCDKPGHWWREHWHISDVEVISWKRDKAGEVK